jgi:hypothetical protein
LKLELGGDESVTNGNGLKIGVLWNLNYEIAV